MSSHYTTDDLVDDIKRKAAIPISQATFTAQDIVSYMNDEMELTITPLIMNCNEEFFVNYADFTISDGTDSFDIPKTAVGQRLRDVVIVYTASNGDEEFTNLPLLSIEQLSRSSNILGNQGAGSAGGQGGYSGFYLQGNKVKIYPSSGWGGVTLRLYYFKRPGKLVPVNKTGKILSIDTGTDTLTLDFVPSTWAANDVVDVIEPEQPFANSKTGLTITSISGFDVVVSSVTGLSINEFVAQDGESPIPQVPAEAHQLLMQSAKVQIMDSQGDERGLKTAQAKYDKMEISLKNVLTPRVVGQAKKVVSRNSVFGRNRSNRGSY